MKKLTIIGAGKVGKTLGHLLAKARCVEIQDIICRSIESSKEASTFIASGSPIVCISQIRLADIYLLTVNDDQLNHVVQLLATQKVVTVNSIVLHCSGSLSSSILLPLKQQGASIASIHPVKSFSEPSLDINSFNGTACTIEGDPEACMWLTATFNQIGAKIFEITSDQKMLYHIATVFSSNYLITLIDIALKLLQQAGLSSDQSKQLLKPLIVGSLERLDLLGAEKALTGPIERGDYELVGKQSALLQQQDHDTNAAYQALGRLTVKLAERKGQLSPEIIERILGALL